MSNSYDVVTIVGNAENPVSGFMVQARDRSSAELLGSFHAVAGKVLTIDCFNGTQVFLIKSDSSIAAMLFNIFFAELCHACHL
jgi:hypothetical protein